MSYRSIQLSSQLLLCISLVACTVPPVATTPDSPETAMVWPSPPETTRIKYLYSFGGPEDLGIRRSGFRRFMDAVAGTKDTGIVRPYAVSVFRQEILVSDTGMRAVHLFDQADNDYRLISAAGDEAFGSPVGVALGVNRIFVADSALGKVFILDREGDVLGSISGLQRPTGLAFDMQTGQLYVADTLAHKIAVYSKDGQRLFEFGARGTGESEFNFPSHISLSGGNLLVNDNMNFRIQTFDTNGRFISSFGTHGDGSGAFSQPKGVASDSQGNIYVAGATIDRVQVFSNQGDFLLAFGGKGGAPGNFLMPAGVSIFDDRIYVADSFNRRIQVFQFVGGD